MKASYILLIITFFLSGCATTSHIPTDVGRHSLDGTYHEVRRGETLWNISKIYNINLERIIKSNRLPNASKIEVGQLIFIPGASATDYSETAKLESFVWPARGKVVSYYGALRNMVKNKGIDIEVRNLSSVVASRSGKVSFVSDNLEGYGKTIIVDHPGAFQTVYAYNAENLVRVNDSVKQGSVIAKAGKSGRADKPTLHFEIRKKHKPQNPFYYLP